MIRWPLTMIVNDYQPLPTRSPVPFYSYCPNARGVDDPEHQPVYQLNFKHGMETGKIVLPADCSCGFRVTEENAKRGDAY